MELSIEIKQPFALNELSQRENNEDSIYPSMGEANSNHNLFIVCDGVGGSAKGEVASKMVCEQFEKFMDRKNISDENSIKDALLKVEEKLYKHVEDYPESKGMATTLTLLHLHNQGATIAHIGDSRVYQVRNGNIIFQTEDHSHVNELIKVGAITPEQAIHHPKKNIITRAIQAIGDRTKADVYNTADIKKGDYFFLCTDGILEGVSELELTNILKDDVDNLTKMQRIKLGCQIGARDNYSCYLVQIENCTEVAKTQKNYIGTAAQVTVPIPAINEFQNEPNEISFKNNNKSNAKVILMSFMATLIVAFFVWQFTIVWQTSNQTNEQIANVVPPSSVVGNSSIVSNVTETPIPKPPPVSEEGKYESSQNDGRKVRKKAPVIKTDVKTGEKAEPTAPSIKKKVGPNPEPKAGSDHNRDSNQNQDPVEVPNTASEDKPKKEDCVPAQNAEYIDGTEALNNRFAGIKMCKDKYIHIVLYVDKEGVIFGSKIENVTLCDGFKATIEGIIQNLKGFKNLKAVEESGKCFSITNPQNIKK